MSAKVRWGLIAGIVGLVINVCVATVFGLCGPLVSLLAGAAAGFMTVRAEAIPEKNEGAREGAISGAIAGALVLIGQLIGGAASLSIIQSSGTQSVFGIPLPSGGTNQAAYYISGMVVAVCFGLVGILLSAGAGAGAGYLASPQGPTPYQPVE